MKLKEFLKDGAFTEKLLSSKGYWGSSYNYYLFVTIYSLPKVALFGLWNMKYAILNISEKGVAMINVNNFSTKVLEDQITFVGSEKIKNIAVKKSFIINKITVDTNDGNSLVFKANNKLVFPSDQIGNIQGLVSTLEKLYSAPLK